MNRIDRVLVTLLLLFTLAVFGSAAALAPNRGSRELAGQAPKPEGRVRADAPTAAVQPSTESKSAPAPDSTAWHSELFLVRPEGSKGPLVAYEMSDGREQFTLPAGMLSADGQHYYAAHTLTPGPSPVADDRRGEQALTPGDIFPLNMLPANGWSYSAATLRPFGYAQGGLRLGQASPPGSTRLDAFDSGTGNLERSFVLDGDWALSGVSPSGRWLALTRTAAPLRLPPSERGEGEGGQAWAAARAGQWKTSMQIVDADNGQVVHVLNLDGNFEVETISADGKSLFLVQHLPAVNPDHYLIRLYDLSKEQLLVDPLRAKGADEVMAGLAWDGIASPDGRWLLTLYLSTRRNVAFIHALNLHDKYPVCLDLPSGSGDFDQLKHYTVALSPDGRKAYATNPVLGVVAEVGLNQLQVMRTVTFDSGIMAKYAPHSSRSLVSNDGRTLYFSSGPVLWRYDIASRTVSAPHAVSAPIVGLGLSGDDQQLFVASEGGQLITFDVAAGSMSEAPRRHQMVDASTD